MIRFPNYLLQNPILEKSHLTTKNIKSSKFANIYYSSPGNHRKKAAHAMT